MARKAIVGLSHSDKHDREWRPIGECNRREVEWHTEDEYVNDSPVKSIVDAKVVLSRAVYLYNEDRPHMSIGNHYPSQVHRQSLKTDRLWKNYYKKNPIIVKKSQD